MITDGWLWTEKGRLPSGNVAVKAIEVIGGRVIQFVVAPDEFAVHGVARVLPVVAAQPGPPTIVY